VKEDFEFRTNGNGTKIIKRGTVVYLAVKLTSKIITSPILPSTLIRKAHKGGDTPPTDKHPC
jgi:hypothetical protein